MIRGLMVVGLFLVALIWSTPDGVAVGERDYSETVAAMVAFDRAPVAPDSVPTWPGLTGSGAYTWNQCDTLPAKIHNVTTTANGGGAGTFDSVMHQMAPDSANYVIFNVGGVHSHSLNHKYEPQEDCVWIAGETAPGDGFILESTTGNENFFTHRGANNLVIRGMTMRNNGIITGGRAVAASGLYHNYIWSFNSLYFTNDQIGNGSHTPDSLDANRVKYGQWSYNLIGPSTNTGMTVQANGYSALGACSVSINRNVWAHINYRMPLFSELGPQECGAEAVENLVYNWQDGESCMIARNGPLKQDGEGGPGPDYDPDTELRFVANWCKPGPRSGNAAGGAGTPIFEQRMVDSPSSPNTGKYEADMFSDRNYSDSAHSLASDTISAGETQKDDIWHFIVGYNGDPTPERKPHDSTYIADFALDQRFPTRRKWSALMLVDSLLPVSGNYRGWNCYGDEVTRADAVRDSIYYHIENGTGFDRAYLEADSLITGGFPSTATGTSCTLGTDGVPDSVTVRYWGVADTVTWEADQDDDGYSNIREVLIGTDPTGGETEPPPSTTYPSGRDVYLPPWVTDTVVRGSDTVVRLIPDPDSIAVQSERVLYWYAPGHDSAYTITCGTPAMGGKLTEAEADSVHDDWELPQDPDTVTVGGC